MRMAAGSRQCATLSNEPYASETILIEPFEAIDAAMAFPFDAQPNAVRNAKHSKQDSAGHDCCGGHDHGH